MSKAAYDPTFLLMWHGQLSGDRAGQAALRRAQGIDDLLLSNGGAAAFTRLRRRMPTGSPAGLARAVLAVAEVNEDAPEDGEPGAFGRHCAKGPLLSSPKRGSIC